jgi:hypothetical protein
MLECRIGKRINGFRSVGIGYVRDKDIVCNKQSKDGSGKANLVESDGCVVWGVLFEIPADQIQALDDAEGGYTRQPFTVVSAEENELEAEAYVSDHLTPNPVPYDWYKDYIVKGAIEHGLPIEYVRKLEVLPSKPDSKCPST